jgi:hypothetical protein
MWPFKPRLRPENSDSDTAYYNRWIDDIVRDQGTDIKSLLEHVKHHVDEGLENGVDWSWVASILNLVDIIARHQKEPAPSILMRINRLFHHWKDEPFKMTPPPTRMPPSVRDFLKLKLESAGSVIEEAKSPTKTLPAVPGPKSMGHKPDQPGFVYHSDVAGKDVWCPIVGRSS